MQSKKGQSQYISWILLFGMVVALSYVLYNWSLEQAQARSDEIKARTDPLVCGQVGIVIKGYCQDPRSIQFNLSNTNNFDISKLQIKTVGLYPEAENYLETTILSQKVLSGVTENIRTLKQGTLAQLTVVPIVTRDGKDIYCEEHAISVEDIKQC